jgi:flagellar biosynthesis protein FlhF
MRLESFRARDLSSVARSAEALFGDEAVVLHTRTVRDGAEQVVEVVAASAADVDAFRAQLTPAHLPNPAARRGNRPYVVALVGPTGAGKTTTIAKLAANVHAFGTWRVGMITLDTFRVAGLEQIATYAEINRCPLEVAYDAADAARAIAQLNALDVILVDTPGRSPKAGARDEEWWPILRAMQPDEIHLVVPAGLRPDVAMNACNTHVALRPTHQLLTKLDDVPDDTGVADLAALLALPTRWLTDGLDVPADLKLAPQRILASLGLMAPQVTA